MILSLYFNNHKLLNLLNFNSTTCNNSFDITIISINIKLKQESKTCEYNLITDN